MRRKKKKNTKNETIFSLYKSIFQLLSSGNGTFGGKLGALLE